MIKRDYGVVTPSVPQCQAGHLRQSGVEKCQTMNGCGMKLEPSGGRDVEREE